MKAKNDEQTRFWARRQGLRQLLLYFEVGQGSCNVACSYCMIAKRGTYARMAKDELRAAVDFLREYAVVDKPSIHMFGMEPLRAWDLIVDLRRYAPDLPLSMTTNGTLLNDERIAWLTENNVRIYVYSIDGNAYHHRFRVDHHGRNTWERAAENLRKLCKTRQVQWVTARASWDPGPEGDYDLVARFVALEELGVRSIQVVPVTDSDTEWDEGRVEKAYLCLGEHYKWGRTPSKFVNDMLDRMLRGEETLETGHGAGCGTGRGYWAVFPPGGRLALCQLYMEHPEGWLGSVEEGVTNPLPFLAISDRVLQWHRTEFKNTEKYACHRCHAFKHCEAVGFCFKPKTAWVLTDKGLRWIEEVRPGDLVSTKSGAYRPVIRRIERPFHGIIKRIKAWYIPPIFTTPEHPFWVYKDGEFQWVEARDLRSGDYLTWRYPTEVRDVDIIRVTDYVEDVFYNRKRDLVMGSAWSQKSHLLPNVWELDDDLLWLFGWFLAEGSARKERRRNGGGTMTYQGEVVWTLCGDEMHVAQRIKAIGERKFGIPFRIKDRRPSHNVITVACNHVALAECFRAMFGNYATERRIPEALMLLPPHKQRVLVEAIFYGDGYNSSEYAGFGTSSGILALQVRDILFRLGLPAALSYNVTKTGVAYHIKLFGKNGGWLRAPKHQKGCSLIIKDGIAMFPVAKVDDEHYEGPVYNLTVDDDSTYTVNGAIVHNCAGIHMQRTGDELLPPDNYCAHTRGFVAAMRKWAEEHRRRYPQRTGILNGALQSDGPCRWQAQVSGIKSTEGMIC